MSRIPRPHPRALAAIAITVALGVAASAAAPAVIRVRRGDTLWDLAREHGTTVEALRELNRLPGTGLIFEGQTLRLTRAKPAARAPRQAQVKIVEIRHRVVSGDSLIAIARRYGVSPDVIAVRNKLPASRIVRLGQSLVIPRRVTVRPATPSAARATAPGRVSRAYVRQLIIKEARSAGIDANLVLALAWQESGLQQHVTSGVGAVGVMQVMPSTGEWVARYLVRRPLNLRDVEDNVLAGVRYLRQLLRIAGSTELALAGYYQGLASVRRRGMYTDTKAYVRNILALRRRLAAR